MGIFSKKENRNLEDPKVPISSSRLLEFFGLGNKSESGIVVTVDKAMGVPAVWASVNFLSGTLAGLPLNVFKKNRNGDREKIKGGIASILHDAPNDSMSSFEWRKYLFERVFSGGRGYSLIDRNSKGQIVDIYPLNPDLVTPKNVFGRRYYVYKQKIDDKKYKNVTFEAKDIIDVPFMLKSDGLSHYSPILSNKESIGLSIAATNYGAKFFNDGGVPPFVITGPFQSESAMKRAGEDLKNAVRNASKEKRLALPLPSGHEIKTLGVDPEKSQLVELKKYCNEEIARIYSLPVIFIQDLTKGTYANTEQQDLHLVKHTIKRWVEQLEQELNLKLFGRGNSKYYVEFNLDGLLRGDFKTRMEGYSTAVQNSIMTPAEIRNKENLPSMDGADNLFIQGATVPIQNQLNLEGNTDD